MRILGVIPARYASSRFPGKPLAIIDGKSMIRRVFEQARKSDSLSDIIVATDDQRIASHCKESGAPVIMTDASHQSGTDRCQEAYMLSGNTYDYVINIQGDEPFIDPVQITELAAACNGSTEIITQMIRCNSHDILFNPGEVKIVLNKNNDALYFSRNVIPFMKNFPEQEWHLRHNYWRHVGMYAYRTDKLAVIAGLKPSSLELAESLEQLRWLEAGLSIRCIETKFESHCIDTPGDIEKVLAMIRSK